MTKITITIDGDNVTVNQSAAPTKVEKDNKKFFIIICNCNFDERSWVEFVSDNYIAATNKLKCLRNSDNNDYSYKLLIQGENETIIPCNGTDWDINKLQLSSPVEDNNIISMGELITLITLNE